MSMQKARRFISEMREGDSVDAVFCVNNVWHKKTKHGAPYLDFEFRDRTGTIAGKLWDLPHDFDETYPVGSFVRVRGIVHAFGNQLQIKVNAISKVPPEDVDLTEIIARTPGDIEKMFTQVKSLLGRIENSHLCRLTEEILNDENFCDRFRNAPAAMKYHHAYIGGLLEHTLSVMRLAVKVAGEYSRIDPDVLLCGAFIHDLGKIREYELGSTLRHTDEGRLVGHLLLGVEMLNDYVKRIEGFPEDLRLKLVHMILSHHGMREWGAALVPKTLEAVTLHHIDIMDARVKLFSQEVDQAKDSDSAWTSWSNVFGAELYKGRIVDRNE